MNLTIKPGIYRLARDVENPQPDRRRTRDWYASPTIPAGTRFRVDESEYVQISKLNDYSSNGPSLRSDLAQAMIPALVPEPTTLGGALFLNNVIGAHVNSRPLKAVLARLVESGKVTIEDVLAAAGIVIEQESEDFDALLSKHGFED